MDETLFDLDLGGGADAEAAPKGGSAVTPTPQVNARASPPPRAAHHAASSSLPALGPPTPFGSAPRGAQGSGRACEASLSPSPSAAVGSLAALALPSPSLRSRMVMTQHDDPEECSVCLESFEDDPAVLTACR